MIRCGPTVSFAAITCLFLQVNGLCSSGLALTGPIPAHETMAALTTSPENRQAEEQAGGQILISYDRASLSDFIQAICHILGISPIQIDPDVQGSVTIRPSAPIDREDLRKIFDKILFENQAVLRKSGSSYRVSRRPMPGGGGSAESAVANPPQRAPVRVAQSEQEARLIHRVEPVYPDLALRARVSGTSLLEVTINEQGEVALVRIIRSGHPLLQLAAVDAVRQWRYLPACVDGVASPVITTVAVTFNFPGAAADAGALRTAPAEIGTSAHAPVRVTGNQQAARLVYWVEPEYSETARKEHLVGTAWLDVTVEESGKVFMAKLLCGSPLVEQAVIDAVRQWRYVPAEINGTALPVVTVVSIAFDLRDR